MQNVDVLINAIFRQAFEDYNSLIKSGKTYSTSNTIEYGKSKYNLKPKYSIDEIRNFLKSNWCKTLLSIIDKEDDIEVKMLIDKVLHNNEVVPLCVVQ